MYIFIYFSGMATMAGLIFFIMPKIMFITRKSRYNFSETIEKLEKSIIKNKWGHRGTWFIHNDFKKKQIEFNTRIANINFCNAVYASEILRQQKNRFVASLMPCALSVWKNDRGKVFITKMNTGLMGYLFGGTIAKIMTVPVSKEEKQILKDVVSY